jgi:hypothetical protein
MAKNEGDGGSSAERRKDASRKEIFERVLKLWQCLQPKGSQ